jgi:polar amino acid transport system substrate-binding protein
MVSIKIGSASLKTMGFLLFLWPAMHSEVVAAEASGPLLTFDRREHRAMPDISSVPRIRFLTTLDFPPFEFLDAENRLSGFNVDLARELCETLQVTAKCQIQALPFGELQSALENRAGDAVIAGIGVTPELRSKFDFSRPYLQLSARFLSLKKTAGEPVTPMKLAASKVGVVKDTAHQAMLKAFFPNVNPQLFDDRPAMLKALKAGEVDTVFGEGLALAFWSASGEADNCCAYRGGPYYSGDFLGEGMTIMTRPGEPLAAAFDHGLLELARSGKLNELFIKYFPPGLY